jgi:hypothetical protein
MRKGIQKLTQTHACFPVPYLNILSKGNTEKDKIISLATYPLISAEFMAWKYKSEWKASHITIVSLMRLASNYCKSLRTDNTDSAFSDAVIYTRV